MPSLFCEDSLIPLRGPTQGLCSWGLWKLLQIPPAWPSPLTSRLWLCLHCHHRHLNIHWASQIQHVRLNSWHPCQIFSWPFSLLWLMAAPILELPWLFLFSYPTPILSTNPDGSTFKVFPKSHPSHHLQHYHPGQATTTHCLDLATGPSWISWLSLLTAIQTYSLYSSQSDLVKE